jgi:hypothetical protein
MLSNLTINRAPDCPNLRLSIIDISTAHSCVATRGVCRKWMGPIRAVSR